MSALPLILYILQNRDILQSRRITEIKMNIDVKSKKLFLLDMDGTLYLDNELFPDTIRFLSAIRKNGGNYLFLTNNSSKGVDAYITKMHNMGIHTKKEDFVTSVDATIEYLLHYHPKQLCYVLGTQSFYNQLQNAGIEVTNHLDNNIEVLVMGFDTELTFKKLEHASILLKRDIAYIATNPDWVCPTAYGYVPDCGSVAQMLKNATGKWPLFIGKPETSMIDLAMKQMGVPCKDTVLIGDRVYTDIAAGNNAKIDTILVLSGEGTIKETEEKGIFPTAILEHIGIVADMLEQ